MTLTAGAKVDMEQPEPLTSHDVSFSNKPSKVLTTEVKVGGRGVSPMARAVQARSQLDQVRVVETSALNTQGSRAALQEGKDEGRSPMNAGGKPLWLQPAQSSGSLAASQSSRALPRAGPSRLTDSTGPEKLNKRQAEQLKLAEREKAKSKERLAGLFELDSKTTVFADAVATPSQPSKEPANVPSMETNPKGQGRVVNNLIEESLDSFDLFKVTNLGRINNEQSKNLHLKPDQEPKRKQWGRAAKQEVHEPLREESKDLQEAAGLSQTSEFAPSSQGGRESTSKSSYK